MFWLKKKKQFNVNRLGCFGQSLRALFHFSSNLSLNFVATQGSTEICETRFYETFTSIEGQICLFKVTQNKENVRDMLSEMSLCRFLLNSA